MNAQETAAALIARYEGFREEAYQDSVGVWTVGYGTIRLDGRPVVRGVRLEEAQARRLLGERIAEDIRAIRMVAGRATENQVAAFTSLAYNVGRSAVLGSTAMRLHKEGFPLGAAKAFLSWDMAGGSEVKGLLRRRCGEAELYLTT